MSAVAERTYPRSPVKEVHRAAGEVSGVFGGVANAGAAESTRFSTAFHILPNVIAWAVGNTAATPLLQAAGPCIFRSCQASSSNLAGFHLPSLFPAEFFAPCHQRSFDTSPISYRGLSIPPCLFFAFISDPPAYSFKFEELALTRAQKGFIWFSLSRAALGIAVTSTLRGSPRQHSQASFG